MAKNATIEMGNQKIFFHRPTPASFSFTSFIFGLFKQTMQFLQKINANNVHLVYGTSIRTHDLLNMSRHP